MSFASLAARRRLSGLLGCLTLLLVLASLFDGMIAGGFKDPNRLDLLPGQGVKLSEQMPRGAEALKDIRLRVSDPRITVRFEETFSGFWMGGTLWRAETTLASDLPVGEYSVAVLYANGTAPNPPQAFTLRVHPDAASIRAASGSLITRTLGPGPYVFAVGLLPLALASMAASYFLSRRIAQTLKAEGMCEIFRSMAAPPDKSGTPDKSASPEAPNSPDKSDTLDKSGAPAGQHIFFCPGAGHALAPGSLVEVLDERGQMLLGTAEVAEIVRDDVKAVMHGEVRVRPGSLVRLPRP